MSAPILTQCGCVACANQARMVLASLESGSDPTNMIAWVNSFCDSSFDTVPWNTASYYYFSDPTQTSPTTGPENASCSGGGCYSDNSTLCPNIVFDTPYTTSCGDPPSVPCDQPFVSRTQYYLPFGPDYFVVALGTAITANPGNNCNTATFNAVGCTRAGSGLPTILEVPIPDNTGAVDDTILVNAYILGILLPGATPVQLFEGGLIPFEPSLAALNTTNQNPDLFGPNWSGSLANTCAETPDDPFTGAPPP